MFKIFMISLLLSINGAVWAANRPCMTIAEACKAAGFSKDGSEGKDIVKDCVTPIVMGKTVPDVTFNDQTVIDACKVKMEEMEKSGKSM